MLLNFQQMIIDFTGLDIANASLLDESSACGEAMMMAFRINNNLKHCLVDKNIHPQHLSVLMTRSKALGIILNVDNINNTKNFNNYFAVIMQPIATNGVITDYTKITKTIHNDNS